MSELPSIAITIVTYNSSAYIGCCLESVARQAYENKSVVVVDNASSDSTRQILREFEQTCTVIYNAENTGFAAAQNQAMSACESKWVLALNPDVLLAPDFLQNLVRAGEANSEIGTVCGKLYNMPPSLEIPEKPLLDSTGIFLTPALRHLDRGSRMPDDGLYDHFEYVFGATGAAALYRREMIDDISVDGEFFDSDFFAYREDADVAWRAQILGWKCLYAPNAIAYHVRSVLPENRRSVPAVINMHSVKNRWLLRLKNMTGDLYRRYWLPITARDLAVIGGCLTVEWRSLPGFFIVARRWKGVLAKRREIMKRRRTDDAYLRMWLSDEPVALPAADIEAQLGLPEDRTGSVRSAPINIVTG